MPPLSQATREILWNVSSLRAVYLLFVVALLVCTWGLYAKLRSWARGKSDKERLREVPARTLLMLREVFLQQRVRRKPFPGLIHVLLFYSFLVLVVTTTVIALDHDFGTRLFRGYVYVFLSVAAELGGIFILIALAVALWRRHVRRPPTLESPLLDTWAFLLLALIVVTGFAVEALRITAAGDPWGKLSFLGYALSPLFAGLSPRAGATLHISLWWLHAALAFLWMATIPFTRYFHLLALPANAFLAKRKPAGALSHVDLDALVASEDFDEQSFSIGVDTTHDLTWKQRLDGDACVGCGRCDEVCPPHQAGQPFSPKTLITSLRDLVRAENGKGKAAPGEEIVGRAFDQDFVWYCLTCMACMQSCPAFIAHVDTFIDIRRNEVSMKGRANADVTRLIRAVETHGNPFGSQIVRAEWVKSLGVRILEKGQSCDVLYWVGCLTTFDEQKRRIAEDLIAVLRKCGVDFALLGRAEVCCGDPARICGAEAVFQSAAKSQVEALNARSFRTLLVSCPHCYNALKNEYPQFGGNYRVLHHSEFLQEMLRSGRLRLRGINDGHTLAFHDPCYLGRYQGIFDGPREVLHGVPGLKLAEMRDYRQNSSCCGGGGGHFWMETKGGRRVDTLRIRQAREVNAATVVTACPYCFHMLTDATKTMRLDREIGVVDLVTQIASQVDD